MIKNYLISALRHIQRNKLYSLINILGLAFSAAVCLVLYSVIVHELSYNKKINDSDRIFRVYSSFSGITNAMNRGIPTAILPTIREKFTGVEAVFLGSEYSANVSIIDGSKRNDFEKKNNLLITEPSYFKVFDNYDWIIGSPEVLNKPSQVVLTESQARLYFNSNEPTTVLGKQIIYQDSIPMSVAGIVKDLPFNTDLNFTDFISQETLRHKPIKQMLKLNDWNNVSSSNFVFIKVDKNSSIENISNSLNILDEEAANQRLNQNFIINFKLDDLSDLHYNSDIGIFNHSNSVVKLSTIKLLITISILLLFITIINYVNLETARASTRAKEVGIRKVNGAKKNQLIVQFFTDSLIVSLFAISLSYPIAHLLSHYFTEFLPEGTEINISNSTLFLLVITAATTIVGGIYPALIQASFSPIQALKTERGVSLKKSGMIPIRRSLIVFQCIVAQFFIFYSVAFLSQMNFVLHEDLGFSKDGILYFDIPWQEDDRKKYILLDELLKLNIVEQASLSFEPPLYQGVISTTASIINDSGELEVNAFKKFGDENFTSLYDIKLVAGRNLTKSTSVKEVLINETMMRELGLENSSNSIGKLIEFDGLTVPIVGVVKDFNIRSFYSEIPSVMIANDPDSFYCINIKLNNNLSDTENAIGVIQQIWKRIYPNDSPDYRFLSETISNLYKDELRLQKIIIAAAFISVFISCFGLFGMVSYNTAVRSKEMSIRKLLGSSEYRIMILFSSEILTLVSIGFLLSLPASWYIISHWLKSFTYRTTIGFDNYALTFLIMVLISLLCVGYQIIKSANLNIVEKLRNN